MRVRFTPRARLSVREKRAWWEQHRDNPQFFLQELANVVGKLRDGTDAERQQYAARGGRIIWRLLMPKTRSHVYYRLDDAAGEVEVLVVWNAVSGQAPELRNG